MPGGGNDAIDGSGTSVNLEVYAAGGTDTVLGGTGNDFLWGGSGNDTVTGNNGNDTLVGETGADTLTGGAGTDALYGTSGNGGDSAVDTFVFTDGWGTDFVFDFEHDVDKLDVSAVTGLNSFADFTGDQHTGRPLLSRLQRQPDRGRQSHHRKPHGERLPVLIGAVLA